MGGRLRVGCSAMNAGPPRNDKGMKTPEEWLSLRTEMLHHGENADLFKWISAIQREAYMEGRSDGIGEASEMCGGDSHIQEGILYLLKPGT